jgi:hypothetical protein
MGDFIATMDIISATTQLPVTVLENQNVKNHAFVAMKYYPSIQRIVPMRIISKPGRRPPRLLISSTLSGWMQI